MKAFPSDILCAGSDENSESSTNVQRSLLYMLCNLAARVETFSAALDTGSEAICTDVSTALAAIVSSPKNQMMGEQAGIQFGSPTSTPPPISAKSIPPSYLFRSIWIDFTNAFQFLCIEQLAFLDAVKQTILPIGGNKGASACTYGQTLER